METSTITIQDINIEKCKKIKNCIESYLIQKPKISLFTLENITKVPYSTLRRIISLKAKPKAETAAKIFSTLGNDKGLFDFMRDYHPAIAAVMAKKFDHNKEYTYVSDKTKSYFSNPSYYLILNLACTTSGTTKKEITFHIGDIGIERLNHLIEEGLIEERLEGRYFGKVGNYKLPFSDTKERIRLSLDYYRLDEAGSINNWMSFQTESINDDGLKALKELNRKHFNERKDQIYNNPMYKGEIKHYSACVSSTFLPYAEDGGVQ